MWADAAKEGLFEKLWEIRTTDHKIRGILGVTANGDFGKNEGFYYIMSVVSEQTPPEQMVKMDFPQATWAVFECYLPPEENKNELWVAVAKK